MTSISPPDPLNLTVKPIILKGMGVVEAAQARLFQAADADGDGGLSGVELAGIGGAGGKSDPALIAALDTDGDGRLALSELKPSRLFSREGLDVLLAAQGGLAGYLMAEGDTDGDGALSREEFRSVGPAGDFARLNAPSDEAALQVTSKADRAFLQGDADEDGVLTRDELGKLVAEAAVLTPVFRSLNAGRAAESLVAAADADGSGGLSAEEAKAVAGARGVDVQALLQDLAGGEDGELSLDDMRAAIARLPDFYRTGAARLDDPAKGGDMALQRLFRETLDRIDGEYLAAARGSLFSTTA